MVADAKTAERGQDSGSHTAELDRIEASRFRGSFSGDEADVFFVNPGGGKRFVEGAYPLGFRERLDGRAVVPFDMDGDGLMDLAVRTLQGIRAYRNVQSKVNHFIQFELKAPVGQSELGALVRVTTEKRTTVSRLHLDGSFQSQILPRLHFGLGRETKIKEVLVQWPWGAETRYLNLDADRRYRLLPSGKALELTIAKWSQTDRPVPLEPLSGKTLVKNFDGENVRLGSIGKITIVNLWAPWCAACKTEIPHLRKLAREKGGTLSVVGLGLSDESVEEYRQFIREHSMAYPQRLAPQSVVKQLYPTEEIRLPTTLVFDAQGVMIRRFNRVITEPELDRLIEALDVKITAEDLTWRAELGTQDGDDTAAYLDLKRAADREPGSAILLTRAAYKADRVGRGTEALAYARKAIKAEPRSEIAWKALRRLMTKRRGAEKAAEQLALAPKTGLLLLLRSELATQMKQPELALELALEAQTLSPHDARINYQVRWLTEPELRRLPIKKKGGP